MCRQTLATVSLMALLVPLAQAAEEEKPRAKILEPKDGQKVAQFEDFKGWIGKGSWPVVVVRPMEGDQPWYVQDHPTEVTESGNFVARCVFGTPQSKGVKFRIGILVVSSKEQAAAKFPRGKTLKTLPADLPTSTPVNVVRE